MQKIEIIKKKTQTKSKNKVLIIDGIQVSNIHKPKPGKHGAAKTLVEGIDPKTGKKIMKVLSSSHSI